MEKNGVRHPLHFLKHIKNKNMILFYTQVSVAGLAELPSSTKTEIKRQLIRFAQLASILDGCESILGVVVSHKPVVIPVTGEKTNVFFIFFISRFSSLIGKTGLASRSEL